MLVQYAVVRGYITNVLYTVTDEHLPAYAAGDHGGDLRRYRLCGNADGVGWRRPLLPLQKHPVICASLVKPAPRRFPLASPLDDDLVRLGEGEGEGEGEG